LRSKLVFESGRILLVLKIKYQLMRPITLLFLIILLFAFSCKKETADTDSHYSIQISKMRNGYLASRAEVFALNETGILSYSSKTSTFYTVNNQANFNVMRTSFLTARNSFLLCGPYLYGGSGVSLPHGEVYGRLDAYPINMEYIDYSNTNSNAGIINDVANYPLISEFNIKSWDKIGGQNNSSCGMHAIEFLLWGQDLTLGSPGNRSVSDFTNLRRRQYLLYASSILKNDMMLLSDQAAFKNDLLAADPAVAFEFMMTGILKFIKDDFAANGIKKSLDSQSDADEISRFSDQTNQDLKNKLKAIRLFYNPRELFITNSEYFLVDFVKEIDPDLDSEITLKLDEIEVLLAGITVDFDQAIVNPQYRQSLAKVYTDLIEIHDKLAAFSQKVSN